MKKKGYDEHYEEWFLYYLIIYVYILEGRFFIKRSKRTEKNKTGPSRFPIHVVVVVVATAVSLGGPHHGVYTYVILYTLFNFFFRGKD